MGREARVALILTAAGCLLAVMVDWAVQELNGEPAQPSGAAVSNPGEASQESVEAAQENTAQDAAEAQDATAESYDQG
jgi:hypothetical protein